jgi:iron complex transport system ATP-binding protein
MVTLRIQNLAFSYDAHPVFSGVDMDIEKGEVVSVVGKNGAGKSTLLKCINHILRPSCGTVYVDLQDIAKLPSRTRAQKIGYLSQKNESLFPITVFETVLTGRYPYSPIRFTRHDEEIAAEIMSAMGLEEFAQRSFDRLSGGEQQQVLIARALAQKADVLLFDEPTSSLDLRHQLDIMHKIRSVAHDKGMTVVMAIHDINLAAVFSDRVIVVHNGRIVLSGTPSEALTESTLKEVFGVGAKIYDHNGVPHIVILPDA